MISSNSPKALALFATLFASVLLVPRADAVVLMLDFGPTEPIDSQTNSPYHTANASFTGTTWNQLQTSDVASGLLYADGTAATGVSVNLGTESGSIDSNIIDFTSNPASSNALGTGRNGGAVGWFNSGIFAGNSVGKDGIWGGIEKANGMRIDGMAAGIYEIYVVGWNTNEISPGQVMNLYTTAGSSAETYDFSGLTAETSTITNNVAWTEGANYAMATITIGEGQSLFIANDVTSDHVTNPRGFFNSVQIVQTIPEPGVAVLFLSALGGLAIFRRRRA